MLWKKHCPRSRRSCCAYDCRRQLEQAEAVCRALQPENVLRRGYSMTLKDGKVVTSPSDVRKEDVLETRVSGGTIVSRVEESG